MTFISNNTRLLNTVHALYVCLGIPLATCTLPVGVCYLLTYLHVLAKLEVAARPLRLTCTCTPERRRPLSATMLISAGGPSAMASATLYALNGSCTGKTAAAGALGAPRERAPSTLAPVTRAVSPTGASAA